MTGGLIGALVGAGMTEERARVYQTAIEEGGIVLSVSPRTSADAEWIEETWQDCGAEDVYRNA